MTGMGDGELNNNNNHNNNNHNNNGIVTVL